MRSSSLPPTLAHANFEALIHEITATQSRFTVLKWEGELKDTLNAIPSLLLWDTQDDLFDATTRSSWITFLPRAIVVRVGHARQYVLEDVPELAASAIANVIL